MSRFPVWCQLVNAMESMDALIVGSTSPQALHTALSNELRALQDRLFKRVPQITSYHILFALVLTLDERVLSSPGIADMPVRWPLLQKSFFGIEDGGHRFFLTIDELMGTTETDPLVFEVYIWCIRSGFRGRYGEQPEQLSAVLSRLETRLYIPSRQIAPPPPPMKVYARKARSPVWLYATAVVMLGLLLVVMSVWPGVEETTGTTAASEQEAGRRE